MWYLIAEVANQLRERERCVLNTSGPDVVIGVTRASNTIIPVLPPSWQLKHSTVMYCQYVSILIQILLTWCMMWKQTRVLRPVYCIQYTFACSSLYPFVWCIAQCPWLENHFSNPQLARRLWFSESYLLVGILWTFLGCWWGHAGAWWACQKETRRQLFFICRRFNQLGALVAAFARTACGPQSNESHESQMKLVPALSANCT